MAIRVARWTGAAGGAKLWRMSDLESRRAQAEVIIASPGDYKVCEGCESILRRTAVICPLCKGYRFDDSPDRVASQARELGSREATTIPEEDWE